MLATLLACLQAQREPGPHPCPSASRRGCSTAPRSGRVLINFSILKAREQAWELAVKLAPLPPEQSAPKLAEVDGMATTLATLIANPLGLLFNAGLRIIRLRETNDLPRIVQGLAPISLTAGASIQ